MADTEYEYGMEEEKQSSNVKKLYEYSQLDNIAPELHIDLVNEIGKQALEMYEVDLASQSEWLAGIEKIDKLIELSEQAKTFPWVNASNIKYPLLYTAAIQFAARAYPAIVETPRPVKGNFSGEDPDGTKLKRSQRVGEFMSWQLLTQMEEWEGEQDKLLTAMPFYGEGYKKVYFSTAMDRNTSHYIPTKHIIVNDGAKDIRTVPRISEEFALYPYEIREAINAEVFSDYTGREEYDQEAVDMIAQHTLLDLDNDGYPEPYIVTIVRESGQVLRIEANYNVETILVKSKTLPRPATLKKAIIFPLNELDVVSISKEQDFIHYIFQPDPQGGFHGIGFGQLLGPLNKTVNNLINMIADSGVLANTGGGFLGSGVRESSGTTPFAPGEWKKLDFSFGNIRDQILPMDQLMRGPSAVLFSLLGLLIDSGKEMSSVQDVMTGGGGTNMPATSVLAQIEQGMKVFTSIYKRIHRSFKQELDAFFHLNSIYLPESIYFGVMDSQQAIAKSDFASDLDVQPVSDPTLATEIQKMGKAQFLMQLLPVLPGLDPQKIGMRLLGAADIENPEQLFAEPGPTPEQMQALAELEIDKERLAMDKSKVTTENMKNVASAIKSLAEADLKGQELDEKNSQVNELFKEMAVMVDSIRTASEEPTGIPGVEGQQPNQANGQTLIQGAQGPAGTPI